MRHDRLRQDVAEALLAYLFADPLRQRKPGSAGNDINAGIKAREDRLGARSPELEGGKAVVDADEAGGDRVR